MREVFMRIVVSSAVVLAMAAVMVAMWLIGEGINRWF